ncbi:four-carbon acid sugar kinase family protein [Alkalicoccus chagannorensis]|uniref:four-carbon acid sugar kinase family protein n=1 Tax=Alkalicoccus chagannorensis TaxID=427072 RepID=UPI00042755EF|nr:four-carbon acid sugar kinase family protein [Alkalicoccus chagannorensis]
MKTLTTQELHQLLPPFTGEDPAPRWTETAAALGRKIVVLDDDPTGVQTVHGISVFTDWDEASLREGMTEEARMFFVLTNSRSFASAETKDVHTTIAKRLQQLSRELDQPFLLISRSDSTMRGHYPLETETLRQTLEAEGHPPFDGEVLLPFFAQGGRWTVDDVHYAQDGDRFVPVGETEFANDPTFAFTSSRLPDYIEEKTGGAVRAGEVLSIPLDVLRSGAVNDAASRLMQASDFQKIVVNAVEERDVQVFCLALAEALAAGKTFLFRSGASLTKVLADVPSQEPLSRRELRHEDSRRGGLVVVGSHVQKTTDQLQELLTLDVEPVELDCHLVVDEEAFADEKNRVRAAAVEAVESGKTAVVYTRRELIDFTGVDREEKLRISTNIADALTGLVQDFPCRPAFILAKGGITSSDIGSRGLRVRRATVIGQAAPGVPVWLTDASSKFPHTAYIVFPGNVGTKDTVRDVVAPLL